MNMQSSDSRYYLKTTTLNNVVAPTDAVSLNSQKITNLATPTVSTDAATKGYVDTLGFSKAALAQYIKVGTVYVGDVNGGGSGAMTTTGVFTSATKSNGQWGGNASLV